MPLSKVQVQTYNIKSTGIKRGSKEKGTLEQHPSGDWNFLTLSGLIFSMFRSKETRLELSDSDSDSTINNVDSAPRESDDKSKTDIDVEMEMESTAIEFNFADTDEPNPSQIYHAALEEFAKLQPLLKVQMDWGDDEPLDDEMKDLLVQVKEKVAVKTRIITGLFDLCLDRLGKIIDTSPLPSLPLSTNSASSATPSKPRHPRKPQPLKKQNLVPTSSNLEMLKTHVFCAEVLKEYYQLVGFRGYAEEADRILQNAFKLLVHFKNDGGVNATIIDQVEELWSDVILSLVDLNIVKYRLNYTSPLLNVLSTDSLESHSSPKSTIGSYEDPLESAIFWFGQIASHTFQQLPQSPHSKRSDGQKVPFFRISQRLESLYLFQRDTVHPQLLSQYVDSSSESESDTEQSFPSKDTNGQTKDHCNHNDLRRQPNTDPLIPIHHQTLHLLFRHLHRAIAWHPEEFTTSTFASENNALWGSLLYYMTGLNGNIIPDDDSAERECQISLLSTALEKLSISYEILQSRSGTEVPYTSQSHSHKNDSAFGASSSSNDKAKYVARERVTDHIIRTQDRGLNGGGSFDSQDDVHYDSADSAIDSSTEIEGDLNREEGVPRRQLSSCNGSNNSSGVGAAVSESETEYASQEEDHDDRTFDNLEKWKLQYFPLISQIHLKLSSIHPSEEIVMEHYRSAIHLLKEVLRIDPNNAAVKSQLSQLSAVDEPTSMTDSAQESEPESESETELKVRIPISRRITRNSKVKSGLTIHNSDNDEADEDAENNDSLHSKNENGNSEEIEHSDEEGVASDEDESDSDEEYEFEWEDSSGSSSSEDEELSDNDKESTSTASAPGTPSQISSPTLDDEVEDQGGQENTNAEKGDLLTFLENELEDAERQKRKRRRENGEGSSSGSGIGGGSVAGKEFKKRKRNDE